MLPDVTYSLLDGFDPSSATLMEPMPIFGSCLPELDTGRGGIAKIAIFDGALTPMEGDLVYLLLDGPEAAKDGRPVTMMKQLHFRADDGWLIASVHGTYYLADFAAGLRHIAPLVAIVEFGPSWGIAEHEQAAPEQWKIRGVDWLPSIRRWPRWPETPTLADLRIRELQPRPRIARRPFPGIDARRPLHASAIPS